VTVGRAAGVEPTAAAVDPHAHDRSTMSMTGPFQRDPRISEILWIAEQLLSSGYRLAVLLLMNRALCDHGDRPELRVCRARARMALGRMDAAERDLGLALRQRPESATIHRLLCEIALCRGDLARAELLLERAVDLDPDHPRVHELAVVTQGWRAARSALLYRAWRAA
jgi:Flp pilus assembly protein TadD